MMGRRFVRCGRCGLRFIPEKKKAAPCPACGGKALSRWPEPFHLGLVLLFLGAGAGALELRAPLGRAAAETPARPEPRETARVVSRQVTAPAEAGPRRGKSVTLRRGDVLQVRSRSGETLLVEDARGNQVRVKAKHVELR